MRFNLVDAVLETGPDRIVTIKHLTFAEEYLADHFPTFPVLPGVLMVEAMVQAARALASGADPSRSRWTLGQVKALKFGAMVRPGDSLRVEVSIAGERADGLEFRGTGTALRPGARVDGSAGEGRTAVAGKFVLRPPAPGLP